MVLHTEIEFKCPISKSEYEKLIKMFELENNIYKLTNYYFDTDDNYFYNNDATLRIRHKLPNRYKVTLKSATEQGALEQHVFLNEENALKMIAEGFNVNPYFEFDKFVNVYGTLDNYRVSIPYKDGELFFDKIEYFGIVDYEVEYEVDDYETGLLDFKAFLSENKIKVRPAKRKSERVFEQRKEK
ncbi:MAG: CYTH domain-containing protein [Acholeplasmataceae bacterium]|jgi:uncharacterized protein YjbK|nr:CYTH domain-containing protein [Acholeplasmataceae bacterium]